MTRKKEGWVAILARAAECSPHTVKEESLKIAVSLDYEDFKRFALKAPWVLKE